MADLIAVGCSTPVLQSAVSLGQFDIRCVTARRRQATSPAPAETAGGAGAR
jgi:hypothetical protein